MAVMVRCSLDGGVARIELDKPPVNAFDLSLVEELAEVVRELAGSDARLAIFSGRGPSLAAGGDIKWMYGRTMGRDGGALRTFFRAIQTVFDDIDALPFPTIAVVHGMTLGGGARDRACCDLRIAADDARIGFPEATIGLIPAAGGTQRLTELVGRPRALELMYTGRVLSAGEALELGLFNRVVPAAGLSVATDELVSAVLASTDGDSARSRIASARE